MTPQKEKKIMSWLKKHDENYAENQYKINSKDEIDVVGNVRLSFNSIDSFPFQFGKISHSFNCAINPLTSLKGAPYKVGGTFNCSYCQLTNLDFAPNKIGIALHANGNKISDLRILNTIKSCKDIRIFDNPIDTPPADLNTFMDTVELDDGIIKFIYNDMIVYIDYSIYQQFDIRYQRELKLMQILAD
jgi:hypothetical protein